jgi:hypothetical protein
LTARVVVLVLLALVVVAMMTNQSMRRRAIMRKVAERVEGFDRFVDAGVVLRVVKVDPNGPIHLDSGRRARVVREHRWGGVIDTKAIPPRLVGPSRSPKEWMCSEEQEPIILHADTQPLGQLVIGAEGGGKTTALAMWHHRQWIANLGEFREGLQTAPTLGRLGNVQREMQKLWRPSWAYYANRDDFQGFELCDGTRIRFVSTAPRAQKQGSPIQGFNSSWAGRDEMQDQIAVHADIESRGRAAKAGRFKQLATATAKDDPEWRTLRDQLVAGGQWSIARLLIADSPFVAANFLAVKRASAITDREFRRRYLAEDLAPESRVYFNWDRKENLRAIPRIGARKITSIVLGRKTGNPRHSLLIGHDPGTAKAASIYLDAYEVHGEVCWWVRGELFTLHKTSEQHARQVLSFIRDQFGVNQSPDREIAHVRAQPVGQAEDRPDLDVYRIWRRVGFDIKAAQYKKDGTGTGQIKKDTRIEMINRLLGDASNPRRLFIDIDEHGKPVAPKLVEAFETMERDHRGRAEHEEKDEKDPTDSPCALGYALWAFEKESATALRSDIQRGLG